MLQIKSIPAFHDNYIWLIENSDRRCAVVDPGDAEPVLAYLEQHGLTLEAILITHHHNDHIGGVPDLVRAFPNLDVVAPKAEPIPTLTHPVEDGDQLSLFDETFLVIGLPGHTLGHVAYVGDGKLFCGDTLFSAGCGRVFEGTYEQMHDSLNKLARLPQETEVYCAHEYTLSNLAFAMAVEPTNVQLRQYREDINRLRGLNRPSLPTTLRQERLINPFLRVEEPEVIQSVNHLTSNSDPVSIFTALREWKNEF